MAAVSVVWNKNGGHQDADFADVSAPDGEAPPHEMAIEAQLQGGRIKASLIESASLDDSISSPNTIVSALPTTGRRMPSDTVLGELAASALRKAVRYMHAGCGNYDEWTITLHQPAVTHDPRDPLGPNIRGFVEVTIRVPKAWREEKQKK